MSVGFWNLQPSICAIKERREKFFFLETASSSIFEEKHAMVRTKDHWYFSSSSEAKATPKAKSSVMNHQCIFYLRRESTQVKVVARVVVAVVVNAVTAVFTVAGAVVAASAVVVDAVFDVVAVIVVVGVAVVVAAAAAVIVVVATAVVVGGGVAVGVAAAALAVDDGAAAVAVATAFVFVVVATTTAAKVLLEILSRYQGTQPNVFFSVSCFNGRLPFLQQPLPPPPISWEPPPPLSLPMTVLAQPQCTYFGFSGRAKERSMLLLLPSLQTPEIAAKKSLDFLLHDLRERERCWC